jgi:hypothetical protein
MINNKTYTFTEDGTRIWRISNGIGYSPAHPPDPICPSWSLSKCAEWCEMTSQNEGKLLQVALNSRHAWYLTDRGVNFEIIMEQVKNKNILTFRFLCKCAFPRVGLAFGLGPRAARMTRRHNLAKLPSRNWPSGR